MNNFSLSIISNGSMESESNAKCWVHDCEDPDPFLHKFPSFRYERESMEHWIIKMNNPEMSKKSTRWIYLNCYVCDKHFKPTDKLPRCSCRLRPHVVPTLHLGYVTEAQRIRNAIVNKEVEDRIKRLKRGCAVLGCRNEHCYSVRFPRREEENFWICVERTGNPKLQYLPKRRIADQFKMCTAHFTEDCFLKERGLKLLNHNVLPTLELPYYPNPPPFQISIDYPDSTKQPFSDHSYSATFKAPAPINHEELMNGSDSYSEQLNTKHNNCPHNESINSNVEPPPSINIGAEDLTERLINSLPDIYDSQVTSSNGKLKVSKSVHEDFRNIIQILSNGHGEKNGTKVEDAEAPMGKMRTEETPHLESRTVNPDLEDAKIFFGFLWDNSDCLTLTFEWTLAKFEIDGQHIVFTRVYLIHGIPFNKQMVLKSDGTYLTFFNSLPVAIEEENLIGRIRNSEDLGSLLAWIHEVNLKQEILDFPS